MTSSLPPHSVEAERGVLGALLAAAGESQTAWEETFGMALEQLGAGPEACAKFYVGAHGAVYDAMQALDSENRCPDLVLLHQRLKDQGELEETGGASFLAELAGASASRFQIGSYLEEVIGKWRLRRSIRVALEHVDRARCAVNPEEVLAQFEGEVIALGDEASTQGGPRAIGQDIPEVMESIEKSMEHRRQGLATGLQYPWSYANKMLTGLIPRQLTTVAGESSSGKTSLALNIAEHVAVKQRIPVGILSVESARQELIMRLLCINARVNGKKVHSGFTSDTDLEALVRSAGRLTPLPVYLDDRREMTPLQIRLCARRLVARHGCKLIILDHLHECSAPEARGDMKLEGKLLMAACRWVALTLNIPMIVLAQLNREGQREMSKSMSRRPVKSDIRESGYIEQMADNILILYRDRAAEKKAEDSSKDALKPDEKENWLMNLEVVKQRNGPTGHIELNFHRPTFRFLDRYVDTGSIDLGERARARVSAEMETDTLL